MNPVTRETAKPLTRADALVLERAEQDFNEGLEWVRTRLRENKAHPPLVARAMEMGVMGAVSTLQMRPRYRDDVLFLLNLAHRVNAGEDAATLARDNLDRALRMRELRLVARVAEPEFAPILDRARDIFVARLPDLARMVAVPDPDTYPDLVTRAFPDEAHVLGLIAENRAAMLEIIDHFARHPRLLRIPQAWVPSLTQISRDVVEWETDRVSASVRRMYKTG